MNAQANPVKPVASKTAPKQPVVVSALVRAQEAKKKQEEIVRARRERIEQLRRQHGKAPAPVPTPAPTPAATASQPKPPAQVVTGGSMQATPSASASSGAGLTAGSTNEISTGGSSHGRADEDNIYMTDKESSASGSDAEDDYDADGASGRRPRQKIPRWARGEVLRNALHRQFGGETQVDPES
jgi:hypothetical protein